MNSDTTLPALPDWKALSRAPRMVRLYDRKDFTPGKAFKTSDDTIYGVLPSGAFLNVKKDRSGLSVKARKRARRAAASNE